MNVNEEMFNAEICSAFRNCYGKGIGVFSRDVKKIINMALEERTKEMLDSFEVFLLNNNFDGGRKEFDNLIFLKKKWLGEKE